MYRFDILKEAQKVSFLPVPSQSVVYTKHFEFLSWVENPSFCFEYRAASDGNVALRIELEQSNTVPAIDGAADDFWCVPDDALEFNDNLEDEAFHIKSYPPAPTRYGRFKITGLPLNDASTGLNIIFLTVHK